MILFLKETSHIHIAGASTIKNDYLLQRENNVKRKVSRSFWFQTAAFYLNCLSEGCVFFSAAASHFRLCVHSLPEGHTTT